MAFVWHQNSDSRQPKVISNLKAKASTTFTFGVTVKLVSGRWEPCGTGDAVAGVYNGPTYTSGTDDLLDVIEVRPGDEFVADYSGTPNAAFLPGLDVSPIAAGALNLDSATVTGGSWAILSVDTANKKAVVRGKKRQLS